MAHLQTSSFAGWLFSPIMLSRKARYSFNGAFMAHLQTNPFAGWSFSPIMYPEKPGTLSICFIELREVKYYCSLLQQQELEIHSMYYISRANIKYHV